MPGASGRTASNGHGQGDYPPTTEIDPDDTVPVNPSEAAWVRPGFTDFA